MKYLTSIKIVKSDVENIKYFDDKFIVGKSDQKSDIFDVLLLACRDVKYVVIPAFIKRISAYAFQFCEDVKKVIFQEKSELKSIGFSAFSQTNIESIQIPDHVTNISSFALHFCEQLKTFSCSEKSELKFIGDLAFAYSSIQSLTIPSSVQFDDKCFYKTNGLTQIKIIQNGTENFKYIDDKFIVGKNNPKSDIFDVLLFVRHDVEEVTVPLQIRRIASFAFGDCFNLKKIDFLNESQLELIENDAFYDCNVKSLTIPASAFYFASK
ncbi:hypothetical protein M9Y10_021307 [Tritrichomonas musculus]|uniref:Surface antigen BspA-like n=1 Tax=Tritrichomonas musculus TaxID=1915356 RepID=A0ABR2HDP1_9EUKA